MRSPIGSAAFGAVLIAGTALLGAPVAHAAVPAPAVSVNVCAQARVNLAETTADLDSAVAQLDDTVTATADELTRRLGLGSLTGTQASDNETAITKIRAVLTLKAAKVLAADLVSTKCGNTEVIVTGPSATETTTVTSSPSASSSSHRQVHRRPKRAPEAGDGSSLGTTGDADHSIAPAMALYALLSVGSVAAVYTGRLWLRGR